MKSFKNLLINKISYFFNNKGKGKLYGDCGSINLGIIGYVASVRLWSGFIFLTMVGT